MRFTNIQLEELDTAIINNDNCGSYIILPTSELIDIVNNIRTQNGSIDLVGSKYENDVYYSYYLWFNVTKMEISIQAEVAHGEKDDYATYSLELNPGEKIMLLWKVVDKLLEDIEDL